MQTFLEKTVEHLLAKYGQAIGELCIVLPNKRSALFIKKYLVQYYQKAIWCPEIFSIEDFVVNLSEMQVADSASLIFELYEAYKTQHIGTPETFDEFCKWGTVLLNDFNEMDRYLVDANQLFGNLKDIKELETWSLNAEELSPFQEQYLVFWKSLNGIYQAFQQRLLAKGEAYQGLAYKQLVAKLNENLNLHSWQKIIFVGFNALNFAEEKIITHLMNLNKAEIIWDTDEYYLNDSNQEAGKFISRYRKQSLFSFGSKKNILIKENLLSTEEKNIHIIGAAKNIAQAKYAGNLIEQLMQSQANLQNTALVLADENLLFPVLHSLPSEVKNVNITMGYPLKNTPVAGFFNTLLQLHENGIKFNKTNSKNYSFHHLDLIKLLRQSYVQDLLDDNNYRQSFVSTIVEILQSKNIVFTSLSFIKKLVKESINEQQSELLNVLFCNWTDVSLALKNTMLTIDSIKNKLIAKQQLNESSQISLELEYLLTYSKIIKRVSDLHINYPNCITDIKVLRSIILQLVRTATLPFYGEPLQGLQVMGMLETRTLDFENIILLSCNEDILPSSKTSNSFIPFELKRYFGLPTYSDRDSIFAYHFYRLLQRAKNIYLMYNTQSDVLGGGEKSRYLAQLIYELPKINKNAKIKEYNLTTPLNNNIKHQTIRIEKNEVVMERLNAKADFGFSPTALNSYLNCTLQFYFKAIAGLHESDEVEEDIGADMLGNAIHYTLETLYKPYVGKLVLASDIRQMRPQAEKLILEFFHQHYEEEEIKLGKNYLTVRVAIKFLKNFFDKEISQINQLNKITNYLTIVDLEKELNTDIACKQRSVKVYGKADRIDSIENQLRIIDYKTGVAEDKELRLLEFEELRNNGELAKSFQLLMYGLMYHKMNTNEHKEIVSGIITFRELSAGLKKVMVNKSEILTKVVLQEFEKTLIEILDELFDSNIAFTQTENLENCEYCSFKNICQR